MFAYIMNLCYSERKPSISEPTEMEMKKKYIIKDCSYLGCINEITPENIKRRARVAKRSFHFCSEYCYEEWLQIPPHGFFLN